MTGSSLARVVDGYDSCESIFETDVIAVSKFAERQNGVRGPERRLMAAILSDGVEAYLNLYCSKAVLQDAANIKNIDEYNEVREWIESRDFGYVFSFDNVCESLGIDPEYLRIGLKQYILDIQSRRRQGQAVRKAWKKIRRPRK